MYPKKTHIMKVKKIIVLIFPSAESKIYIFSIINYVYFSSLKIIKKCIIINLIKCPTDRWSQTKCSVIALIFNMKQKGIRRYVDIWILLLEAMLFFFGIYKNINFRCDIFVIFFKVLKFNKKSNLNLVFFIYLNCNKSMTKFYTHLSTMMIKKM